MARNDMIDQPTTPASEVDASDWRMLQQRLRRGRQAHAVPAPTLSRSQLELVNVLTGQRLLGQQLTVEPAKLRDAAHRVADAVYEKIIGVRGAFATRIAYVVGGRAAAEAALPADRRGRRRRESAA